MKKKLVILEGELYGNLLGDYFINYRNRCIRIQGFDPYTLRDYLGNRVRLVLEVQ